MVTLLLGVGIVTDDVSPVPVGLMVEVRFRVSVVVVTPPAIVLLTVLVRYSVAPIIRVYARQQANTVWSDQDLRQMLLWTVNR
jgi:hypothetical protein